MPGEVQVRVVRNSRDISSGARSLGTNIASKVCGIIFLDSFSFQVPTYRLFVESVFGVMANVGALPLDRDVLHEVREVHEDAVRQTDHDDELRAVAVPSPLLQGDAVDLAQDAVPIWNVGKFFYQRHNDLMHQQPQSHLASVMARMTKSAVVPKMLTRGVM